MRRPHRASSGKRNRIRLLKKGPGGRISRRARPESATLPEAASAAKGALAGRPLAQGGVTASRAETSVAAGVAATPISENRAAESTRCGFGAVRVGPLLGRLRLRLQTERFLAMHPGDAVWEQGVAAALALNEIVVGMTQAEFNAWLAPPETEGKISAEPAERVHSMRGVRTCDSESTDGLSKAPLREGSTALSQVRAVSLAAYEHEHAVRVAKESLDYLASAPVQEPTPDFVLAREQRSRWGESWSTRKTGTAALAAYGAALARPDAQTGRASRTAIGPAIVAGVITSPPRADEGSAVRAAEPHNRTADCPGVHQHDPARGAR